MCLFEKTLRALLYAQNNKSKALFAVIVLLYLKKQAQKYYAYRKTLLPMLYIQGLRDRFLERRNQQVAKIEAEIPKVPENVREEILGLSGVQLAEQIKNGKITCEQALVTYAHRAVTLGMKLNLIADINFDSALLQAQEMQEKLEKTENKETLPKLFGVPITVKEHLKVKGLVSCCGLTQLSAKLPETSDCSFVQLLRNAGCVPFASTNVPQGLFSIESVNNFYGRSKNPHNPLLTVGGSTGGEGGAQALRLSALGVGSDSLGSARIPAAFCGCYSFKGTGKRVSVKGRYGPTGTELGGFKDIVTSIGPLASCVDDLIEVEKTVLGRFNEVDPTAVPLYWNQSDFDGVNLQNVRICVIERDQDQKLVPAIQNVLNEVVSKLKEKGATIIPFEQDDLPVKMSQSIQKILSTPGVQLIIANALKGEELIDIHKPFVYNKLIPQWINTIREIILKKQGRTREAQALAKQKNLTFVESMMESIALEQLKKNFQSYLEEQKIDVIISPVLPFTAIRHGDGAHLIQFLGIPGIANVLDLPAGVIPIRTVAKEETDPLQYNDGKNDMYTNLIKESIKLSEGLPVAIQVSTMQWRDEKCLKIMKEISNIFQYKNKLV